MNYSETIKLIERYKTANRELCDSDGTGQTTHYAVCTGYFSALAAAMLADLPEQRQEFYRRMIEDAVKTIEHRRLMSQIKDTNTAEAVMI